MLVGLWLCVHFVCEVVGEYTHACGVVGVTLCLWGCGCKPITCGVVCVFACGDFDNVPCGVEKMPFGVAKIPTRYIMNSRKYPTGWNIIRYTLCACACVCVCVCVLI